MGPCQFVFGGLEVAFVFCGSLFWCCWVYWEAFGLQGWPHWAPLGSTWLHSPVFSLHVWHHWAPLGSTGLHSPLFSRHVPRHWAPFGPTLQFLATRFGATGPHWIVFCIILLQFGTLWERCSVILCSCVLVCALLEIIVILTPNLHSSHQAQSHSPSFGLWGNTELTLMRFYCLHLFF